MGVGVSSNFVDTVVNGNHIEMAVVIAIVSLADVFASLCCCMCGRLKATVVIFCYIMLYICVADVKPLWKVLWLHVLSRWQVLLPM